MTEGLLDLWAEEERVREQDREIMATMRRWSDLHQARLAQIEDERIRGLNRGSTTTYCRINANNTATHGSPLDGDTTT